MKFELSMIREFALIFFAAMGISRVSADILTLLTLEPSKSNPYAYSLGLALVMLGLKYSHGKKRRVVEDARPPEE